MIELVVMDMAGTTVHDPDGVGGCLKAALAAEGVVPTDEAVVGIMGIPKPVAIWELLTGFAPEKASDDEFIRKIFLDFQKRMIEYYRSSPDVREIEGATEVFRVLRENGVKVALDTGFDRSIVDALLVRLGWGPELIDATATSDEVARGRPFPDLIRLAMQRTGVSDVANVAKVGDTPSDLAEGTAAGCAYVIGVTSGGHTAEQLRQHPHTHILGSIRELSGLFGF